MWRTLCSRARQQRGKRQAARYRPRLEVLEGRCLLSGGVLDPTFGSGGLESTAIGSQAAAFAVATDPTSGRVVAVGQAEVTSGNRTTQYMAVVRYNLDGSLDTSFGGTGEVLAVKGAIDSMVDLSPLSA